MTDDQIRDLAERLFAGTRGSIAACSAERQLEHAISSIEAARTFAAVWDARAEWSGDATEEEAS